MEFYSIYDHWDKMKKVLICGDSFAADWTVKYPGKGWPNLLAEEFNITNLAQAGCGEYKIYKQLISQNLDEYDLIIISHTSAFRLYIEVPHPVHHSDLLHKNSDLIYTDLEAHNNFRSGLSSIIYFFKKFFSIEYAEFVHEMLLEKIHSIVKDKKVIHITNIESNTAYPFHIINFSHVFKNHRGLLNHFDDDGNQIVFEKIKKELYNIIGD